MPKVLVTGGTGTLGREVVARLLARGREVRVLSRSRRDGTVHGNLATGEGVHDAVRGIDTIVHCASSPFRRLRATDVHGTERLLDAARKAGVAHFVYISIVGIDQATSYPYYRAKLEAERAIEHSSIPYTLLRATQFYDLVLQTLRGLDRLPILLVPNGFPGQPIHAPEVADHLIELTLGEPAGRVPDVGGPEILTPAEAARLYVEVKRSGKRVVPFRIPGKTARAFRSGVLTCPGNRCGTVRWQDFLRERLLRTGSAGR